MAYNSPMAVEPAKDDEPADKRTPFERLEELTRRVVSVPKAEVDELRKKRARPKRPSRRRS